MSLWRQFIMTINCYEIFIIKSVFVFSVIFKPLSLLCKKWHIYKSVGETVNQRALSAWFLSLHCLTVWCLELRLESLTYLFGSKLYWIQFVRQYIWQAFTHSCFMNLLKNSHCSIVALDIFIAPFVQWGSLWITSTDKISQNPQDASPMWI